MPIGLYNGRPILLAPSVLAADFARLGEQAIAAEDAGADWLQLDVMDGVFVPNISFGPLVVAALRSTVQLTLDCHLMIVQPERYINDFVQAGAHHITVHAEACTHLHRTLELIKQTGITAGVALNPATPLSAIEEILPMVDLVLIMSVNPGFGGQRFIPASLEKIARLRATLDARNLSHIQLQVDGGINQATAGAVVRAGATNLVAGSAVFNRQQPVTATIAAMRAALG